MAASLYSLSQVFAPARVSTDWQAPGAYYQAYPVHGQRRITPTGLKHRLKRYLGDRPEGFPQDPHAWGHGLKDLIDHELPDRLAVLQAFDPPPVMWQVAFIAGQDWGKSRAKAVALLEHLLNLPAMNRSPLAHDQPFYEREGDVRQRIAEAVGEGVQHTLDPLPGSPAVWAEVFDHWLTQGTATHLGWIAAVTARRPDLVYARAVVRPQDHFGAVEGPQLAPLPVLLTQGASPEEVRWDRWHAWGADLSTLADATTVPSLPLPRAFAALAPHGISVGFALACAGIGPAQRWLALHEPALEAHREAMVPHRELETVRLDSYDPNVAPLQKLAVHFSDRRDTVPSPVWTLVVHAPELLLRDYANPGIEVQLMDRMGWDAPTLQAELSRARDVAGNGIWDGLFGAAMQAHQWSSFERIEQAAKVLLNLGVTPADGQSPWRRFPDFVMHAERLTRATSWQSYKPMASLFHHMAREQPNVLFGATAEAQRTLARALWTTPNPGVNDQQEWGRQHMQILEAVPDYPMMPELRQIHIMARLLFHGRGTPELLNLASAMPVAWPDEPNHWMLQAATRHLGPGTLQALRVHHDRAKLVQARPTDAGRRSRPRS